ncbi:MAG: hypothetical protein ABI672_10520 [Vicinamibacteria bacterium]
MSGTMVESLRVGVIFLGLVLPSGYALLRWGRVKTTALASLALAIGLGLSAVLLALVVELALNGPWLIGPLAIVALVSLRRDLPSVASIRPLLPELCLACVLGALPLAVNGSDLLRSSDGISVRVGFDVSDRAFYGTVSQEMERVLPWNLENPAFAPLPLNYSHVPALIGVFLRRYAGADDLTSFGTSMPALGLIFTVVAAAALTEILFRASRLARMLAAFLAVFGGDLSFLVPQMNQSWLERSRHFFVFYSFSGESLFYNSWMFGVPLLLTVLLALTLFLQSEQSESLRPLALLGLLMLALFETKVFAFFPVWSATLALAVLKKDKRIFLACAGSLLCVAPALLMALNNAGARQGAPLQWEPLGMVGDAVSGNPSLNQIAELVGFPLTALLVVVGGLGFRVLGIRELVRRSGDNDQVGPQICALSVLIAFAMSLFLVGRPTRLDGLQAMTVAHTLLSLSAAAVLARGLQAPGRTKVFAALVIACSVITPCRYLLMKVLPELTTAPASMDRRRVMFSSDMTSLCAWLRIHSAATDRLVMPLSGSEDRGGLRPLYVGLFSSRRLVAEGTPYHVSEAVVSDRRALVNQLYETSEPAEAERILDSLSAQWVWEDMERPLRFRSPRLAVQARAGTNTLLRFEGLDR